MIYFSEFFNVSEDVLEEYGAFNISLINDLPLFIDPFLLFGSDKNKYQQLHEEIINYLKFLKSKSEEGISNEGQIKSWYQFPEVKQNWLGYSMIGNRGSGLGSKFGRSLSSNMHIIFRNIGNEKVSLSSHLEKAGLFQVGIGRDNISDFTCNLIKSFLLVYTQKFTIKNLDKDQRKELTVSKVYFDYKLERWMPKKFVLPFIFKDYTILTPKDILTKDENWISSKDLHGDFTSICESIPNIQLRNEISNYFRKILPYSVGEKRPPQKEISKAILKTLNKYPDIIDYYIRIKEQNKSGAKNISKYKVKEVELMFIQNVSELVMKLNENSNFYNSESILSYEQALARVHYLKNVIEKNDGYKIFYLNGIPIKRESDLQIIYRLTWYGSSYDINREVNNGRGSVDYTISRGSDDKSLVEFKLASNPQLRRNLQNQVKIYEDANNTKKSIKVIQYFDDNELANVEKILEELKLENNESIVLIDAGKDNKISASKV